MNKFQFNQQIIALESGTIKAGTKGRIIDVFQDGAFWKYEIAWANKEHFITIAREKDLTAAD